MIEQPFEDQKGGNSSLGAGQVAPPGVRNQRHGTMLFLGAKVYLKTIDVSTFYLASIFAERFLGSV